MLNVFRAEVWMKTIIKTRKENSEPSVDTIQNNKAMNQASILIPNFYQSWTINIE